MARDPGKASWWTDMENIFKKYQHYLLASLALAYFVIWLNSVHSLKNTDTFLFGYAFYRSVIAVFIIALIIFLTRNFPKNDIIISNIKIEGYGCLIYVSVYIALLSLYFYLTRPTQPVFLLFWLWGMLVILPFYIFRKLGYSLLSFGITKNNLGKSVSLGLLIAILQQLPYYLLPSYLSDPTAGAVLAGKVPAVNFLLFPVILVFALITASFPEEYFFRTILQTRVSALFKSEIIGLLAASVFHGLWHLPLPSLQYVLEHGVIVTLHFFISYLPAATTFGVLWIRTKHIAAPLVYHTVVIAHGGLSMIKL